MCGRGALVRGEGKEQGVEGTAGRWALVRGEEEGGGGETGRGSWYNE